MDASFHGFVRVHSPQKWEELIHGPGPIQRLRCITFVDSPDLIHEFFSEREIDELELVHGNYREDYRELLVDQPAVADDLERLKNDGKLRIWVAENRTLHTKSYEILHRDGTLRLLTGSANLTRNAVSHQVNQMAEFRTEPGSTLHRDWEKDYERHKELAKLFLEDLTEEIETSDEDRTTVIERWVEGRTSQAPAEVEAQRKVDEKLREVTETDPSDGEEAQIVEVSMNAFPENAQEYLEDTFGGRIAGETYRVEPRELGKRYSQKRHLPKVHLDREGRRIVYVTSEGVEAIGDDPPPEDPERIAAALQQVERFLGTVDEFADTDRPTYVKAHMYEALLYILWSPFATATAEIYRQEGLLGTKKLPYLYIWGEPNAGKDTLAKFGYSLISPRNWEPSLVDGEQLNKTYVDALRRASTVYPAILSDVQKDRIRAAGNLRNYWENKTPDIDVPAIVLISNDSRPKDWFLERSKTLNFDCRFPTTIEGEIRVKELREEPNPLFEWVAQRYFDLHIEPRDDVLQPMRRILLDLYEEAGRDIPAFFPEEPAEVSHSIDRLQLKETHDLGGFERYREDGSLVLEFSDQTDGWEIHNTSKLLPEDCRFDKQGQKIVIKNPSVFEDWWGAEDSRDGIWGKLRGLLKAK